VAGLVAATGFAGSARADEVLVDGIAAQVGSHIVLISEVQELARPIEERMRAAGASEGEIRSMHADALERLIEARLIETVVTRLELDATEGEVDAAIAGIAQDNGLSVEQLERSVESHGLTIAEYRRKLKGEIERSKVLNTMVRARVRVEPEEVRAAYEEQFGDQQTRSGEEVHLRHILVAAGAGAPRDVRTACAIAEDAHQKIVAGQIAFGEMARRVTDMNPQAAGELGWIHVDDLAPWMSSALASMQPGDVSDVIETGFGCNLLELVERRVYEPVTFAEAEPALTAEISRRKMDKEYLAWLETLREQTYVDRKGLYAESGRARSLGSPGGR
jgi:peptidyl-prolyl cis-trans isomerase SurA